MSFGAIQLICPKIYIIDDLRNVSITISTAVVSQIINVYGPLVLDLETCCHKEIKLSSDIKPRSKF